MEALREAEIRHSADRGPAALAAVEAVLRGEPGLRWAYVFGSVARGEAFRDVDVAVMPAADAFSGLRALGGLTARLEEATGGVPVDLVPLDAASLRFADHILREGRRVLDREPDARIAWEADTMVRRIDMEPFWNEQERVRRLAAAERRRSTSGTER